MICPRRLLKASSFRRSKWGSFRSKGSLREENSCAYLDKFTTKTFMTGQPKDAARGLSYYMGVTDPFGNAQDGVQLILMEVEQFVESIQALTSDSPKLGLFREMARLSPEANEVELYRQVAHDVKDWLDYILNEKASEKEFKNVRWGFWGWAKVGMSADQLDEEGMGQGDGLALPHATLACLAGRPR